MTKKIILLLLVITVIFSTNSSIFANGNIISVESGETRLVFIIPDDSLPPLLWARAAWVNVVYTEEVISVYAAGQRYTSSYERSVYGGIDLSYDGNFGVSELFFVTYTASNVSFTTPPLTKTKSYIGKVVSKYRYDDTLINITGTVPKGETTVTFFVTDALVSVNSVTVSLTLD